jgi:hypothetical protein
MIDLEKLKYPIGQFNMPALVDSKTVKSWIADIRELPSKIKEEVAGLTNAELNLQYRPGGWTIRQVVHHCADSHMNGFIRHKLALTEDNPTIKPYEEALWAFHADEKLRPEVSVFLLASLHERWVVLLESLSPKDLGRTYLHPSSNRIYTLTESIGTYAWHGNHHLAHIQQARKLQFAEA